MNNVNLGELVNLSHAQEIDSIDRNTLRTQTISELKEIILNNKNKLETIHKLKENLENAKDQKLKYYESGFLPQITKLFHMVTNFRFSDIEQAEEEIERCSAQEIIAEENLIILAQEVRMKELSRIQDWWQENENFFASSIDPKDLKQFKSLAFNELIRALDRDESTFFSAVHNLMDQLYKIRSAA